MESALANICEHIGMLLLYNDVLLSFSSMSYVVVYFCIISRKNIFVLIIHEVLIHVWI